MVYSHLRFGFFFRLLLAIVNRNRISDGRWETILIIIPNCTYLHHFPLLLVITYLYKIHVNEVVHITYYTVMMRKGNWWPFQPVKHDSCSVIWGLLTPIEIIPECESSNSLQIIEYEIFFMFLFTDCQQKL